MHRAYVMFLFVLTLAGCATPPSTEQISNANYGPYPTNYDVIVKRHLNALLKDPSSAQWRKIKSPDKGWSVYFGRTVYGYAVCYGVNAKNSFGGYVGERLNFFMINNGRVIQHFREDGSEFDIGGQAAQKRCYS